MSVSDMRSAKLARKYKKQLSALGWQANIDAKTAQEAAGQFEGPTFYLISLEENTLHLVKAADQAVIEKAKADLEKSNIPYSQVCDAMGSLYSDIIAGKLKMNQETQSMLLVTAASYISGTQSYTIACQHGFQSPQFLIIVHHNYAEGGRLLRPIPINNKDMLSTVEVEHLVTQVISQDMRNHPERFKSATILPFKIEKRDS